METNLYEFLKTRKRPLAESRVKLILYQIVSGVNHMHRNGFFHRDIKPENILMSFGKSLDHSDTVKIGDLGSVGELHILPPHTEYVATRWYRAPECILSSGQYGSKMDVWAIGCVFFEMITLKPLFPGATELDQITKIHEILGTPCDRILAKFKVKNQTFPKHKGIPLQILMPSMSDLGVDIIGKMLSYDPFTRINCSILMKHKYFDIATRHSSLSLSISSRKVMKTQAIATKSLSVIHESEQTHSNGNNKSYSSAFNKTTSVNPFKEKDTKIISDQLKQLEQAWNMKSCKRKNLLLNRSKQNKLNDFT